MKIMILMDSFKGSMNSLEAAAAVAAGIRQAHPQAEIISKPLADGGEGTVEALTNGLGGEKLNVRVSGPRGKEVLANYGILSDKKTVVMEIAQAAGLMLLSEKERDPRYTSSRGVGEMILDALKRGCRDFIIGIGGSATNDGGVGMLQALGISFLDKYNQEVKAGAASLENIVHIDTSALIPEIESCRFRIACDVNNVLCGVNGATYIYGPQKGLPLELLPQLDAGMQNYATRTAAVVGKDFALESGAGAAGGLGFAFVSYLKAELLPGAKLILSALQLENELIDTDYVITGEGRLDGQTAHGKAPLAVARLAKGYNCKVIAFVGSIGEGAEQCNREGIDAYFSIISDVTTLAEALDKENARASLAATVTQVFRLISE